MSLQFTSNGKSYNNEKVIVSLTSFKPRLSIVPIVIFSILKGSEKSVHIVLSLFKDDVKFIPKNLQLLIDSKTIELIITEDDLKPHKKYYYAMKKYKMVPVITIDDDCIYTPDFVDSLLKCYEQHKHSICARRCHAIPPIKNAPYLTWKFQISDNSIPACRKFTTGVGGVLYPPNILDIDNIDLNELKTCLCADDIFLKAIENRKNIDIQIVPCIYKHPIPIQTESTMSTALSNQNVINKGNDYYLRLFSKDIYG